MRRTVSPCSLTAASDSQACATTAGRPRWNVFVAPSDAAIRQAHKEGFRARMLPGVSGVGVRQGVTQPSTAGLQVLAKFLHDHYGPNHEVVLYQASPYPVFDPIVQTVRLSELPTADLTPMSTLYVPPKDRPPPNPEMYARLEIPAPDPTSLP